MPLIRRLLIEGVATGMIDKFAAGAAGPGIAGYFPSLTKLSSLIYETTVDGTLDHLPLIPHNLHRFGDASYS